MKKLFATAALALSLAAVGASANATTTVLDFTSGGTKSLGNTINSAAGSTFSDTYTFSYTSAFDVTSAVISMALGTSSALSISNFTLTNTTTNTVYSGVSTGNAATQIFQISASNLASGNYVLTVTGSVGGSGGGSYGGNISISAVPEASTTAMMLGGLAVVGFAAYRRRNNKVSLRFTQNMVAA